MARRIIRNSVLCALLTLCGISPAGAQGKLNPVLTEADRAAILNMVLTASPISGALAGSRYRVFAINGTIKKAGGRLRREAHTLLYDYTRNITHHVVNDITVAVPGRIIETNVLSTQLPPHAEEVAEAKELVLGLPQVKQLVSRPNVLLQQGFPVDSTPPPPCNVNRCLEIQVNEVVPRVRAQFLLIATVDLSARKVVQLRDAKGLAALSLKGRGK